MSHFAILTDSSANLSPSTVEELGVTVLPLNFTIQGHTYRDYPDCREMELALFYDMLRADELATTSAVRVEDYLDVLHPLLSSGQDVLILSFSSALSATYQSACLAAADLQAQYPQRKIYTVDSRCASAGLALLVSLAVKKQREGCSLDEVRQAAEEYRGRICHHFTVNDLHFLRRGGRISSSKAYFGSFFQIKPILCVNPEGRLVATGRARGRQSSLKTLVDRMGQNLAPDGREQVFISHADCPKDAQLVADMVRDRFQIPNIYVHQAGPVIGAHTGPGGLVLCYLGTSR